MDVLMLTLNDWANTGYRFSRCLEIIGLEVQFFRGAANDLIKYPEQKIINKVIANAEVLSRFPIVVKAPKLRLFVEQAHVVHFIASTFIDTGADLSNKFVVAQHGGATFRQEPKKTNIVFNPIVSRTIVHTPDLLGLGAKNEVWLSFPVDTSFLQPDFGFRDNKILVGHFPSTGKSKRTDLILGVVKKLEQDVRIGKNFKYIGVPVYKADKFRVPWLENLERVKQCDIIIDACNIKQKGKVYGEWANAALEAAALGKVVVTHSLKQELYKEKFGKCSLFIANNEVEIEEVLRKLLSMDRDELLSQKRESRKWVVKNHSMEVFAKRLWSEVYSNFFKGKKREELQRKVDSL